MIKMLKTKYAHRFFCATSIVFGDEKSYMMCKNNIMYIEV